MRYLSILVLLCALACGDDDATPVDATIDSDAPDTTAIDSGSLVSPVAPPALPDFSTCPPGWRRVAHALAGLFVCEPWPETGPADCASHEAHFPGEAGCTRIGSACPSDGWPTDLPAADVTYVRAAAPAGGDGSRAWPLATLAEGVAAAADGGTVAIAVGAYDERVIVPRPMRLVGACAEGVVVSRAGTSGIAVIEASDVAGVEVRDLTIRSAKNDYLAARGSDLMLRAVSFDGTALLHNDGDLNLEEVAFRDYDDATFSALSTSGRGVTHLTRVAIVGAGGSGANINPTGAAYFEDVSVRESGALGLQVSGAEAHLDRVVVEGAVDGGLIVDAAGTSQDVVVRGIVRADETSVGHFSPVGRTLERVRVEDAGDVAVIFINGASTVSDLVVVGPSAGARGTLGRGIELAAGADVTMSRVVVLRTAELGILAHGSGTRASLSDLTVADVEPAAGETFGRCLHAQVGAEVNVERVVVRRCSEGAVTASYGGSVTLRDARVQDTLALSCELGCDPPPGGVGLVALEMSGRIDAERFVIEGSALAGVQVVPGGEVDLRDGTIQSNPVGVNVQVEGYDITRVMRQVVFRDNGVNLDSTELPVPAAMLDTTGS